VYLPFVEGDGGLRRDEVEARHQLKRLRDLHASACVSIRQHTSAYISIRQHTSASEGEARHELKRLRDRSAYVSIRIAYVSIRQHTSAYVSIRSVRPVGIRQHTPAYASIRSLRPSGRWQCPCRGRAYADVCWRMLTYAICMLTYAL
jgi:hypothetical protein